MFSGVEAVSMEASRSDLHPSPTRPVSKLASRLLGVGAIAGMVTSVLPVPQAIAETYSPYPTRDIQTTRGDYQRCTSKLVSRNISAEDATSACARALKPSLLTECVVRISGGPGISPADALDACRRVRFPTALASCVVDLRQNLKDVSPADSLGYCRRNLFPERFARCVIGESLAAKTPPSQLLDTCSDGTYFPREVDSTFLTYPLAVTEPSLPSSLQPLPSIQQTPAQQSPVQQAPAQQAPASPNQQVTPQRY